MREGVVEAGLSSDKGVYTLSIEGLDADKSLPDGYRFLGWYEVPTNENGEPLDVDAMPFPSTTCRRLTRRAYRRDSA